MLFYMGNPKNAGGTTGGGPANGVPGWQRSRWQTYADRVPAFQGETAPWGDVLQ